MNNLTPISIEVIGDNGSKKMLFHDTFSCFKKALETFILGIRTKRVMSPKEFNRKVVHILEIVK